LKDFKKIINIVKNINKEELLVNAGNVNVKDFKIEYDKEHISEIFKFSNIHINIKLTNKRE
jgi:hypothetical protein